MADTLSKSKGEEFPPACPRGDLETVNPILLEAGEDQDVGDSVDGSLEVVQLFEYDILSSMKNLIGANIIFEPVSGTLLVSMNEHGIDIPFFDDSDQRDDDSCGVFQLQIVEAIIPMLRVMRRFPSPGFRNFAGMAFDPNIRHLFLLHGIYASEGDDPKGVIEYALNDSVDGLDPVIVQKWPLLTPVTSYSSPDSTDSDPCPPKLERMDCTNDICIVPRRK